MGQEPPQLPACLINRNRNQQAQQAMEFPSTVRDLLNHPEWDSFIASKLGNDLFYTDADRAKRIHEAAENGADGSTHAELIEDWREFAELMRREFLHEAFLAGDDAAEAQIESASDALDAEINACERHHQKAGTLHEEVG
jgi:hypothetical protein